MNMFSIYNKYVSIDNETQKGIANKIIAKTKDLTLSSEKYNKYLESFSDASDDKYLETKTDYILPIIDPFEKNKNKSKKKKTLTPKMNKKLLNAFSTNGYMYNDKHNRYSSNKTLLKKNINFFICDFDYSNKEEAKNEINNNIGNNKYKYCLTQENFIKYKKRIKILYNNKDQKEKEKDKINIKIINDKEKSQKKQIFCLLDSVFIKEKNDENKANDSESVDIFNEKEIFGYKDIYLEHLRNELMSLINKQKEIVMNSKISYHYNNKIYGEIIMELNSAKIEVYDKINDTLCSTINIPFDLLCIFYLSTVKQLAHIILNIFKNDFFLYNQRISSDDLKHIFENMILNQISYKNNNLVFNNNFEDIEKNNISTDYLNYRNMKFRANVRYNILSLNKKAEALKNINFENCSFNSYKNVNFAYDTNGNIYNKSMESMKTLFDSSINIINLSWITLDKNYLIKTTMPLISVKMTNYKKQINQFINKEIFVFLYKNNFKNWNFYISHYLFTLKKFRACINNILSYYTLFSFMKRKNKTKKNFNLDKTEVENYKNNLEYNLNKNLSNNLLYEQCNLSNLGNEQYENSLNDNEYIFFVSDDEYIHLYKMKSYVLFLYSCSELKHPSYCFPLTISGEA